MVLGTRGRHGDQRLLVERRRLIGCLYCGRHGAAVCRGDQYSVPAVLAIVLASSLKALHTRIAGFPMPARVCVKISLPKDKSSLNLAGVREWPHLWTALLLSLVGLRFLLRQ